MNLYKTIVQEAKSEGIPYEKAVALAKKLESKLQYNIEPYIKQHVSRRGGHYYVSPEVAAIVLEKDDR